MLVYNKLDFCQPAVESVVENCGISRDEFDFHVWDNAAPYPGVAEYLEKLREQDWPTVDSFGFNSGVGAALNQVVENTDSEYFLKIDDDCLLIRWTLPLLLIAYAMCESAGFPIAVLSADVIGVGKAQTTYEVEVAPGMTLQSAPCVGGGCVVISRRVLEDVGPFRADRLYGVEDGDFAFRAVQKGYMNCYLKDAYHVSRCRTEEADPRIDAWKLDYFYKRTALPFEEWQDEENLADFYGGAE